MNDTERKLTDEGLRDSSARMLPANSVILSSRAPIGHLVINEAPMATNQGCKGLVPGREIDSKYLYYYLTSITDVLDSLGTGATFRELSAGKLREVPMPVPALHEQQRIVTILDKAFAAIATAKSNTERNLRNARALFRDQLRRAFARNGASGTSKRLCDVCEISSALVDPRRKEYAQLLHAGGANIQSRTGVLNGLMTAEEEGLTSGKFLFGQNTVLYSKIRPNLMKVARPNFRGLCSADIYPLSAKPGEIDRDYLYHLLLSPDFTHYAISGSARAGIPKVNREHLFAYSCSLPPIADQRRIAARLDRLFLDCQRIEQIYEKKQGRLDELKQSLLQQGFTGAL